MEDDDIAVVTGGKLSIHRMNRQAGEDPVRAIQTLQMELQQIMKGQIMIKKTILASLLLFVIGLHMKIITTKEHNIINKLAPSSICGKFVFARPLLAQEGKKKSCFFQFTS